MINSKLCILFLSIYLVYIQTGSKSKEKSIEYSSDADARDLLSAIRSVFSDNKELIACCHKMFKEKSSFGIPLFGGMY